MTDEKHDPVFFDPKGRRRALFRLASWSSAFMFSGLIACFLFSIVATPMLPELRVAFGADRLRPATIFSAPLSSQFALDLNHRRKAPTARSGAVRRYAFFNHWDENSFVSLREHADKIDVLVPEWLHLAGPEGGIRHDDIRREEHARVWLKKTAGRLKVLPLINNFDPAGSRWDGEIVGALVVSEKARATLGRNLLGYVQEGGFAGVAIDFKAIPDAATEAYVGFIAELRKLFAKSGLEVYVVLPAYEKRIETEQLAAAADKVILLAYDAHWEGGPAGPLAAQGWFEAQLDDHFRTVDGGKLVVALGSYAVDWREQGPGRRLPVSAAWDMAADAGAQIRFDPAGLNGTFAYQDEKGRRHTVWMLDGVTAFNQTAAALAMEPAGIALWRLGTEDPTVWQSFGRGNVPSHDTASRLEHVEPSREVVYKGEGEVLKATDRVNSGRRTVEYDQRHNLITSQTMVELPRSMTITRWGHSSDKLIALTFDDGPSREYTPEILRILRQKNAKATFFVVGANAALEPGILRAIHADGHDIGNHTFTHPNLTEIPAAQLDMELNATQRVLESKLGVRTALFRPPFVKDVEPETRDQARTLVTSAAMGYITIGLKIDPFDWERPGTQEIVRRTLDYATGQRGNVVLLHDGGGDRSQTVEALPQLIDELRARGFRLVTISELLGLSRDEVMPRLPENGRYVSWINDIGFTLARQFSIGLAAVFMVGIVLGMMRLILVAAAAWVQSRRELKRAGGRWTPLSLAVIVPAYNEEKVICDCISSLLASRGVDFDILVVDDGSTDGTSSAVQDVFGEHPRVKLRRKPNGGKASALNWAVAGLDVEVFVAVDADTRLDPDAIARLVRHFADTSVGAVAGTVHVGNATGLLTRFQALEYVTSQSLDRRALELANGIIVVPGAIGAWRRAAVVEVGGYGTDTLAEDADLTLKLERADWKVLYEPRAFAQTEAPATVEQFLKQRFRWMFGTLQVAFKHLRTIRRTRAIGVKYFALPNILLFQFLFALISPVIDLVLVLSIAADLWDYYTRFTLEISATTWNILAYWLVFQALELAVGVLAFRLDRGERRWSLLPLMVLQRFCYRQLIYWVAMKAAAAAIRGRLTGWGKLQRSGLGKTPAGSATAQHGANAARLREQSQGSSALT
ncbi:MAG: glycosyltransferase [Hyphomicrobiaceae bacterium]|nr:glycosyltransferase [Hyphomicrobiaceae bacterium]